VAGVKEEISQEVETFTRAVGLYVNSRVDSSSAKGELPGSLSGALDVNCALEGIPAFMAEIGPARVFVEASVATGEKGLLNLMKYLNMIPGEIERPNKQMIITKRRFATANKAGFLIMEGKPGAVVAKGQPIARIIDLFEELEIFNAEEDSFIIVGSGDVIVHTGDVIAVVGTEWKEV
jgi:predicted deacylase